MAKYSGKNSTKYKTFKRKFAKKKNKANRFWLPMKKAETKFIDTEIVLGAVASNGVGGVLWTPINFVAPGSGSSQVVGIDYLIKYISMRYVVTAGDATNLVRVMLVRHNLSNEQAPILGDLLLDSSNIQPSCISIRNENYKEVYTVLYDKTHNLVAASDNAQHIVKWFKRAHLPVSKDQSNAGTAADYVDGAIYLVTFSDSSAIPHPILSITTRVGYTDS